MDRQRQPPPRTMARPSLRQELRSSSRHQLPPTRHRPSRLRHNQLYRCRNPLRIPVPPIRPRRPRRSPYQGPHRSDHHHQVVVLGQRSRHYCCPRPTSLTWVAGFPWLAATSPQLNIGRLSVDSSSATRRRSSAQCRRATHQWDLRLLPGGTANRIQARSLRTTRTPVQRRAQRSRAPRCRPMGGCLLASCLLP